jgi:hypothetical protein
MTSKIDLPLSDVIAMTKKPKDKKKTQGPKPFGKPRAKGRPAGGRPGKPRVDQPLTRRVSTSSIRDERHPGGGIDRPRRTKARSLRTNPYRQGNPNDQWNHDLYREDTSDATQRELRSARRPKSLPGDNSGFVKRVLSENKGTKLLVSNLHFKVTDQDLKELFGAVGQVLKATVHYDASGRSKGTATVVFANEADAKTAINEYNGALLDEQAMKVELAPKVIRRKVGGGGTTTSGSFVVVGGSNQRKIVRRKRTDDKAW